MRGSTLTAPARTASLLDRALAVFADVRPGEGLTALLMLANIFLLLVCYSIIKTVREPLVLTSPIPWSMETLVALVVVHERVDD